MPAAGSAAQICFHESSFPPAVTLPLANMISSGFGSPNRGAIFSAIARRVLIAASFTDGDKEAAVVDPPEELALPKVEFPICSATSCICSPNSSATIHRVNLHAPVPISWAPHATHH